MHRLGYVGYIAAAAVFYRENQTAGVLIALALLGWAVTTEVVAHRTTWAGPSLDESGYGTALAHRNARYLSSMDRFAFVARFLSMGIAVFGPLLFVWSLLL